jgi:hypothetical protein
MQNNTQTQPDKKDPLAKLIERNPCARCRAAKMATCKCGGSSSGSGSSSDGSEEKTEKADKKAPANVPGQLIDKETKELTMPTQAINSKNLTMQFRLNYNKKMFNSEIISELLSKKLLMIDNDKERGILTIKLQCDPKLLSEEQRNELKKFVNTILKELDAFKKEHKISANCAIINKDNEGNILSLRIALPVPKIYDTFIQRLAVKNLLPTQNIKQQAKEKIVYKEGMNHFNLNSLSTKPTPAMNKQVKSMDETEQYKKEQKSSSIRPRSPLDGPKPKWWDK